MLATFLVLFLTSMLLLPATALGQPVPPGKNTETPQATVTPQPAPALTLSSSSGQPGAPITANGSGFKPGETVDVTFNGQSVGSPTVNTGATFSLSFTVPSTLSPGQYGVLAKGQSSGFTATTSFTINQGSATLAFSVPEAAPGMSLTVTGSGFQPGEVVSLTFNGAAVGTSTTDTKGSVSFTFVLPSIAPGQYVATATGLTSGAQVNATYTVLAGAPQTPAPPTPTLAPTPVATPNAGAAAASAPALVHDERYFSQTGYRIDDDQVWGFFQQYGALNTFGYPVSRTMSLLGCPVQMFQRQIIQVCSGQGAALINLLDPEIFAYTQVNGSTFPGPDPTMKNTTPPVSSPTYATDINTFVNQNVPDSFNGQPVNFLQTFDTLGGLTIWGAPISSPQPDPSNPNFIYQRFQRGIMHYISGQGTLSILLADYLKAIVMNQNVPGDLAAQARNTRFFNQYCPGNSLWLCRPNELPGTDLTFAFVAG